MFIIAYLVINIYSSSLLSYRAAICNSVLIFGIIASLQEAKQKGKMGGYSDRVLIPVFLFAACLLFYSISMHAASIKITDVRYYSRALAHSSYPRWARDFHPVIRALTGRTKGAYISLSL